MSARTILALMESFRSASREFEATGGVHSAALADRDGILVLREDIGRHNAVDKVVGWLLAGGLPPRDKILLASGRMPYELVLKAARCGLPVVATRAAPTDRGVQLAREAGITLIGFARGARMNVYSGEWRIAD